jgi:hypothetical protein
MRTREDWLRDLHSVSDTALGWLGVDELLHELLDRVLRIVDADTATVLLADSEARVLTARASRGLEEEVRYRVRIPIGTGFAGRIARERRPLMIDQVDSTTVANPILWEQGIQVLLGVPLVAAAEVIGVLHVGRRSREPFVASDTELLSLAADRMAGAIQAEQRRAAQDATAILIDDLRPAPPPACPGLEVAARYLPSERGASGDWYDAFVLPSGSLWVIVGDVAGHGVTAAVTMARVQAILRAFASLDGTPDTVLAMASDVIQRFHGEALATAVCATASPPFTSFTVASAGHLPPVMVAPGGSGALVELPVGPPLGMPTHRPRSSRQLSVPSGTAVVFYTDGLVERSGEPIDAGLGRLCRATRSEHPEAICRAALAATLDSRSMHDDVAVVAIRRIDAGLDDPFGSPSDGGPRLG